MQKEFIKLIKLVDIKHPGETVEEKQRWERNVINSVGEDSYGLDDLEGDVVLKMFSASDVEFDDVKCYNFAGDRYSSTGDERFYAADWFVVREKATGDLYALFYEDIVSF